MRRILVLLVIFSLSVLTSSADTNTAVGTEPIVLRTNEVNNILLARGVFTTIRFQGSKKIDAVRQGSQIFTAKVDEETGQRIDLMANPAFPRGATNMIVTIDGTDYVFVVQISPDISKVFYTRTYVLAGAKEEEMVADISRLDRAPKLRPSQIDINGLSRLVERARVDPVFRKTVRDYRQIPIDAVYSWNGCLIHLLEVNSFISQDLLLFKIEWVNTTGFGLYLNARQVGLTISGHPVRIIASMQNSPDSWVLPGQLDTVWLIVQGERLAYLNPWTLTLPPAQAQRH